MSTSFHPEPPPQNDLERLLRKAAQDPALHGPMWRMMWDSELYTFVPDHPEVRGEFPLQNGDQFTFAMYTHEERPFVAVFTSEAAAEWAAGQIPGRKPAIAAMPAEALFKIANNGETMVRINHGLRATFILQPEAVASLVRGHFTHSRPEDREEQKANLRRLAPEEVPPKLRKAIRVFCVQRPLAVAVYAFNPEDPATGQVNERELDLVVWLRDEESDLFNDFTIMVERLAPPYLTVRCASVSAEHAAGSEFLQGSTPLWPVV